MSLRRLALSRPMCSGGDTRALPRVGFPIRKSAGQRSFSTSPRLIAAVHVLLRLLTPRHPPCALSILTRAHLYCRYAVFKVRGVGSLPQPPQSRGCQGRPLKAEQRGHHRRAPERHGPKGVWTPRPASCGGDRLSTLIQGAVRTRGLPLRQS